MRAQDLAKQSAGHELGKSVSVSGAGKTDQHRLRTPGEKIRRVAQEDYLKSLLFLVESAS